MIHQEKRPHSVNRSKESSCLFLNTDIFHSAHSSSVLVSNTFILSKIYISSDAVYTASCHADAKSSIQCLFLVLEVGRSAILPNDVSFFSVSHSAGEERGCLKILLR